jgi:hypothetical protein
MSTYIPRRAMARETAVVVTAHSLIAKLRATLYDLRERVTRGGRGAGGGGEGG